MPNVPGGMAILPTGMLLFLTLLLGVSALLPQPGAWLAALGVVIVFGVPHGALDGEIARPLLRPRFGAAWFAVFALPYLSLSALVLFAWHFAPLPTLAAFLAASVQHFGEEDAGAGSRLQILVRGGLPIALPTLLHPAATAHVFAVVTLVPLSAPPSWLTAAAEAWLLLLPLAVADLLVRRPPLFRRLLPVAEIALLGAGFWLLPPLTAFSLYFVGLHAPRHMRALAADPARGPRIDSLRAAMLRSLPVTGLTFLLGAMLWPLYPGPPSDRLLTLTLRCLAALTLPHLLLDRLAPRLLAFATPGPRPAALRRSIPRLPWQSARRCR